MMRLPALALLACTVALSGCEPGPSSTEPRIADGPSLQAGSGLRRASGQGIVETASFRTVSFNAVEHRDGSVAGHITVQNHTLGTRVLVRVECLSVQANRAVITGFITDSPDDEANGRFALLVVEDNGEGGSVVDRMSFLFHYPPQASTPCHELPATFFAMRPVDKGNIQVAP